MVEKRLINVYLFCYNTHYDRQPATQPSTQSR